MSATPLWAEGEAPEDRAPVGEAAPAELPEGPGREAVEKGCLGGCHGISDLTSKIRTADEWKSITDTMIGMGAPVSDEDYVPVMVYLIKNFAPKPVDTTDEH